MSRRTASAFAAAYYALPCLLHEGNTDRDSASPGVTLLLPPVPGFFSAPLLIRHYRRSPMLSLMICLMPRASHETLPLSLMLAVTTRHADMLFSLDAAYYNADYITMPIRFARPYAAFRCRRHCRCHMPTTNNSYFRFSIFFFHYATMPYAMLY